MILVYSLYLISLRKGNKNNNFLNIFLTPTRYNATILAYGQTGSGKTYSMGTAAQCNTENQGIVPRFTENLYQWIETNGGKPKYKVKVSFLELYHEDIIDLLNTNNASSVNIREDVFGNISWSGVHEQVVDNAADLLK